MCLKANCPCILECCTAATPDNSGSLEIGPATAIPVSCMRTGSGSICLCHLDEVGHSLSDAVTFESLICDESSSLATTVDVENEFLPPISSSPTEIISSSPRSVTASSDEGCSIKTLISPRSSPDRNLTPDSDDFSQRTKDLELTVRENGPISAATTTCITSLTGSPDESPRFSAGLHAVFSCSNNGFIDVDTHGSASESEGKKGSTTVIHRGNSLTRCPGNMEEMSPITFSSNSECRPLYRTIKRARSYAKLHLEEPLPKRTKTKDEPISDTTRRVYASRAASLRRAESLTTISDPEPTQSEDHAISEVEEPPKPIRRRRGKEKVLPHPVPIIAPPENHVGGLAVNAESLAIKRLAKFLERELDQRAVEGLSADLFYPGTSTISMVGADSLVHSFWEGVLGIGRERRLKAINWLLNVKPIASGTSVSVEPTCSTSTSSISCSSSSSSSVTGTEDVNNLLDQLQTSHQTRFHACWMFLRYFYLVMSSELFRFPDLSSFLPDGLKSYHRSRLERQGRQLVTLDISVACLSLSVKFHRDFLDPLLPVYAREYLALSPHEMSYDDLETAHRDVLSAFRYRLGVSPQPLMDEIWLALPSLRNLLCFEQGWSRAMEYAWTILFRAVCEVDVQMFCVSLLTTVAIMDGIIQSLRHRDCYELTTDSPYQRSGTPAPFTGNSYAICSKITCLDVFEEQARKEADHVLCEIQALVGVSDTHLRTCRFWIERFDES